MASFLGERNYLLLDRFWSEIAILIMTDKGG